MEAIKKILALYQDRFLYKIFYDQLLINITKYPQYHIDINRFQFLKGYKLSNPNLEVYKIFKAKEGDKRIDLPIWFGDLNASKKIFVVGLEPRDSKDYLNIERNENYVFATPFAVERWYKGVYYKAFKNLIACDDTFIYFTDVVKDYEVKNTKMKNENDAIARRKFLEKAEYYKEFLSTELELINPSAVIALGNASCNFLEDFLRNKYSVKKVRHPAQGGSTKASEDIKLILSQ